MNTLDSQRLPSIAGATELMRELSPSGLALNLECMARVTKILRHSLLPRSVFAPTTKPAQS
jgi:hypothetical protein